MNINLSSTDFDFLDPALAYADWSSGQFTYLMDCKLLNYPDKAAPEGTKLQPEAARLPGRLEGRHRLHLHDQEGRGRLQVQHRRGGDGAELRRRDQPEPEPDDGVACGEVHH